MADTRAGELKGGIRCDKWPNIANSSRDTVLYYHWLLVLTLQLTLKW